MRSQLFPFFLVGSQHRVHLCVTHYGDGGPEGFGGRGTDFAAAAKREDEAVRRFLSTGSFEVPAFVLGARQLPPFPFFGEADDERKEETGSTWVAAE